VKKAVEAALNGDRHAGKWVGNYLIGKPESGKLLEVVAKELAEFDSVGSRATSLAIMKPLVDSRIDLFLRKTSDQSPGPAPPT
jgi:hypothetical protein